MRKLTVLTAVVVMVGLTTPISASSGADCGVRMRDRTTYIIKAKNHTSTSHVLAVLQKGDERVRAMIYTPDGDGRFRVEAPRRSRLSVGRPFGLF
jgi:hypothetical protein